jgi:hypothetical protein
MGYYVTTHPTISWDIPDRRPLTVEKAVSDQILVVAGTQRAGFALCRLRSSSSFRAVGEQLLHSLTTFYFFLLICGDLTRSSKDSFLKLGITKGE